MVDHEGVGSLLEHLEKHRNFMTFNRTANERNAMVKHALEQGYIVHDERRHTYQLTDAGRAYLAKWRSQGSESST
jgi:hypothetical protein